ncbi:transposase DNA-binding-containing protein [Burkholderia stagnalis]|nr:transposase DNA-binding-containing protein [Burkholderia stagnalis]
MRCMSRRLVALARQLSIRPHTSLQQALSPAELAAYRFLDMTRSTPTVY